MTQRQLVYRDDDMDSMCEALKELQDHMEDCASDNTKEMEKLKERVDEFEEELKDANP